MKSLYLFLLILLIFFTFTLGISTKGKKKDKKLPIANNMFPFYSNYPFTLLPPQFFYQNNLQFPFQPNYNMSMIIPTPINFLKQNKEKIVSNKTKPANKTLNITAKPIKKENLAAFKCHPNDIYCVCKYHPKYHDCVCLAYPRSVACSQTFCTENPNSYECNPQFCDKKENLLHRNCYCKRNINSIGCKCKLNPLDKECFCMKFPSSHLCNNRICKFNPNSLYCKCKETPDDPICSPKFCVENPKSPQCECVMFPYNSNCSCLNDPNSCSSDEVKSKIIEFDMRIRGSNLLIKLVCNHNSSINNSTLYNMYYPPCVYDKKKKRPKNSPCLPAPLPQKCDKEGNCLDKKSLSPCLTKLCKKNKKIRKALKGHKGVKRQKTIPKKEIAKRIQINRRLKGCKGKKDSLIDKRIEMLR